VEHGLYAAAAGFIWNGGKRMEKLKDYRLSVKAAMLAIFPSLYSIFTGRYRGGSIARGEHCVT